jgi:23S rRNA pseudouridine955/2504/2580 synthase
MSAGSSEDIPILFEDEFIVLVNKPANLPSQPTVDKKRADLFTLLQKKFHTLFLHHRLDKDTSGVILFSKSKKANGPLTEMFRSHGFEKTYWALTKPADIFLPHWCIENHLVARRKDGKSVKMFRTESGGDFAYTAFSLLASSPEAHWVEAKPLTGRTHQIRVHLLHSGASILGDSLYGGKDPQVPRLMLHASSLQFAHPVTGEKLKITAPPPPDFQTLLTKWNLTPSSTPQPN